MVVILMEQEILGPLTDYIHNLYMLVCIMLASLIILYARKLDGRCC